MTVPGPWCPFVNLVQFTPLSQEGSAARPVRTAQVWLDPERNGNWLGSAGYVGGCVLATLSPPAVLLGSLLTPPAYTPQEWQQCVLQEPLISACLDKRFDRWASISSEGLEGAGRVRMGAQMEQLRSRESDVKHARASMASIATPAELGESSTESLSSIFIATSPKSLPSMRMKQTLLSFCHGT